MKIINNTAGTMHWKVNFSAGGGDCGDIAPGAPPYEYPLADGQEVTVSFEFFNDITYTNVSNDNVDYVEVASQIGKGEPPP